MSKEIKYEEAMNELELIVSGIEENQISIDELSLKMKRATELIKICKSKLLKTENDIADVMKDLEQ
ncbi:MAG: exodeoxyribonuclease VII small subunit [Salibacteraceae bacterium]